MGHPRFPILIVVILSAFVLGCGPLSTARLEGMAEEERGRVIKAFNDKELCFAYNHPFLQPNSKSQIFSELDKREIAYCSDDDTPRYKHGIPPVKGIGDDDVEFSTEIATWTPESTNARMSCGRIDARVQISNKTRMKLLRSNVYVTTNGSDMFGRVVTDFNDMEFDTDHRLQVVRNVCVSGYPKLVFSLEFSEETTNRFIFFRRNLPLTYR